MRGPRPVEPNDAPHIGVALYSRDTVDNVTITKDTLHLIDEAIDAYNQSRPRPPRRLDDFNVARGLVAPHEPAKTAASEAAMELELPCDVDPHGPISQLARAATERYGFAMVASVDTSVSLASNPTTDLAIERLQALNKSGLLGFIFIVERAEDRDNESRMDRLARLQEGISKISLPHLTLVTRESGEPIPDLAEVTPPSATNPSVSEAQEMRGNPKTDAGPGMDTLG